MRTFAYVGLDRVSEAVHSCVCGNPCGFGRGESPIDEGSSGHASETGEIVFFGMFGVCDHAPACQFAACAACGWDQYYG